MINSIATFNDLVTEKLTEKKKMYDNCDHFYESYFILFIVFIIIFYSIKF